MVQFSAILPSFLGVVLASGDMRLRMLEVLGHGAYGVVYLAQDLNYSSSQSKYYAVKCLLKQPEDSEHYRLQQREISCHKAASSLPNVVRLHQVIEDDFYMYLVLDYCPGGDLFSAIIDRGVFIDHNERLRRTFLQLLDAVHDCHDIGIYHRDLKPENIMCSADGEDIYLCDFGLATRHKLSVNFGCGSSFYMSPECIGDCTGRKPFVTSISDIWSLGIILTNLITSRNPWHVASPSEDVAFAAYLQQGETWLRRMLPISRGACSILARIFVIEPERRITLHELRNAIKELNSFFPDPDDPIDRLPSWARCVGSDDFENAKFVRFTGTTEASAASDASLELIEILPLPTPERIASPIGLVGTTAVDFNVSQFINGGSVPAAESDPSLLSDASSSIEEESEGPETPETHGIYFSDSIPELSLELPRDPSIVVVPEPSISAVPEDLECGISDSQVSLAMKKRKLPRSWERFVQRIKIKG